MLGYHLELAFEAIRRSKVSSLIAAGSVAVGIGACVTLISLQLSMLRDPVPSKSKSLYHVQIDTRTGQARQGPALDGLNYSDFQELERLRSESVKVTASFVSRMSVAQPGRPIETLSVRAVSSDFFHMFEVPILSGRSWTYEEDKMRMPVALLSKRVSERLFRGASTGAVITLGGREYRVTGVVGPWRPAPKFFDLNAGAFSGADDVYIPIETAVANSAIPNNLLCWADPGPADALARAPCGWLDSWVEIQSQEMAHSIEQRIKNQLADVGLQDADSRVIFMALTDWISFKGVVPDEIKLQTIVALAFLVMCTTNVAGILLLKYHLRSRELAIRRVLGASLRAVAAHVFFESLIITSVGALIGALISYLTLTKIKSGSAEYADIIIIGPESVLFAAAFGLSIALIGSVVAVVRVSRLTPIALLGKSL